jgi:hypothetical protein
MSETAEPTSWPSQEALKLGADLSQALVGFRSLNPGKLGITIIQTPLGARAYVSAIPNEFTTGG